MLGEFAAVQHQTATFEDLRGSFKAILGTFMAPLHGGACFSMDEGFLRPSFQLAENSAGTGHSPGQEVWRPSDVGMMALTQLLRCGVSVPSTGELIEVRIDIR